MNLSQYADPKGGYRYKGDWYEDAHSLVLSGMLGFCGCGRPTDAATYIRDVLIHIDNGMRIDHKNNGYEKWAARGRELGSDGALYFTYYVLDEKGFTEHGGSVPGWLTPKGQELLDWLKALPEEEP